MKASILITLSFFVTFSAFAELPKLCLTFGGIDISYAFAYGNGAGEIELEGKAARGLYEAMDAIPEKTIECGEGLTDERKKCFTKVSPTFTCNRFDSRKEDCADYVCGAIMKDISHGKF